MVIFITIMKETLSKIKKDWDFRTDYLMDTLSSTEKTQLFRGSFEEIFKKGEVVVRQNHVPEHIFYIKKGRVKRYVKDKDGKMYIIQFLQAHFLFGYHSILTEERYGTYTEALEDANIVFIPKKSFFEFLQQNPVFQLNLLKIVSFEFSFMINYISNYINRPVIERVAIQLLIQTKYVHPIVELDAPQQVEIRIKRTDLAALVGASRENIILSLNKLKKEQLIQTIGSVIKIIDLDALVRYVN